MFEYINYPYWGCQQHIDMTPYFQDGEFFYWFSFVIKVLIGTYKCDRTTTSIKIRNLRRELTPIRTGNPTVKAKTSISIFFVQIWQNCYCNKIKITKSK